MIRDRWIGLAAAALMATGMAVAQNSSQAAQPMDSQSGSSTASAPAMGGQTNSQDLPAATPGQTQNGSSNNSNPNAERPGSMGAPQTPDTGATPAGERPGAGTPSGDKGQTQDNGARPGSNSQATSGNQGNVPEYAKPIGSDNDNSNSSKPSQQGTESGTTSPTK